ncbi:MAG: SRPBCC family protein, partial [Chloroflexota bacterium]
MFELDLEDSIVINKPLEEVFTYMDDIEREHEWQPYLRNWEQSSDPHQNGVRTIRKYENRYMGRSFTNE